MGKVKVPAYLRRDGTPVSGYEYERWDVSPLEHKGKADALRNAALGDDPVGETPPVSQLPAQPGYDAVRDKAYDERRAVQRAVDDVPPQLLGSTQEKITAASFTGLSTAAFVALGAPFIAAPFVAMGVAGLALNPLRRLLAERKARRSFRRGNQSTDFQVYADEANERASAFSHWFGEVPELSTRHTQRVGFSTVDVLSSVNSRGVGKVSWVERVRDSFDAEGSIVFYPGMKLEKQSLNFGMNLSGVNMRGAQAASSNISALSWDEGGASVMDGADLREADLREARWGASLRYANLAGADLRGANMRSCDMEGADLTGAQVDGAELPADLTNTNITREQFESLRGVNNDYPLIYRVREAPVDEVVAAYGGDEDAAAIALWSGDIEVRDRNTNKVVVGEFNVDEHYIPHWALSDLQVST